MEIKNNILNTLQVEFTNRQQCTKFVKIIKKCNTLSRFFDFKAERCVWLKFDNPDSRERVKSVLMLQIKEAKLSYRASGIDYLIV